ncbi:MAG: hypothetical protein LAP87_24710 [Acidobacteriia bacterium]|nr:hypothetical protein [Terriglobia bacterium]
MAATKKNPAAVALGRKGGKKGGPARAARLTSEQRSESARKAVRARWAKAKEGEGTSDQAVLTLLKRIKATDSPKEIRQLSNQLERVIFHTQFKSR